MESSGRLNRAPGIDTDRRAHFCVVRPGCRQGGGHGAERTAVNGSPRIYPKERQADQAPIVPCGVVFSYRHKSQQGADMTVIPSTAMRTVEPFPVQHSTTLSDELNRILAMLRDVSPKDATISFDFDGQLHVHIDVRRREDVTILESVLPLLGCGLFHSLGRGATPNHPFFHRVSAVVAA